MPTLGDGVAWAGQPEEPRDEGEPEDPQIPQIHDDRQMACPVVCFLATPPGWFIFLFGDHARRLA